MRDVVTPASISETPFRVEPLLIEDGMPEVLEFLTAEIRSEVGSLGRGLHPATLAELADLARIMDCHYSNVIEGHDARPEDVGRALAGLDVDRDRRRFALEGRAHVLVQRRIDGAFREGTLASPTSMAFLAWVHEAFYAEVPDELRAMRDRDGSSMLLVPGQFRADPREDVAVGRHVPPSSARVGDFMRHFEGRYGRAEGRPESALVAIAAAHHRLNFIHPFLDGNGRVSRLMSRAMALRAGIGGEGLWSISRGFALGLAERGEYLRMMDMADAPRQGSRDGRGNLSLTRLTDFCEWTLRVMLQQVRFAKAVFEADALEGRYRDLLRDLGYGGEAIRLVSDVLRHGELERAENPLVMDPPDRAVASEVSELVTDGFLRSASVGGALGIAFPLPHRGRLFPNLFTGEPIEVPEPSPPGWRR